MQLIKGAGTEVAVSTGTNPAEICPNDLNFLSKKHWINLKTMQILS